MNVIKSISGDVSVPIATTRKSADDKGGIPMIWRKSLEAADRFVELFEFVTEG